MNEYLLRCEGNYGADGKRCIVERCDEERYLAQPDL